MSGLKIEIKQAQEKDIPIIEDIMLDVISYLEEIGQPQWSRSSASWEVLSARFKITDFYIAYLDGIAAGCLSVINHDPGIWEEIEWGKSLFIHRFAVKRFAAKRGVSKALLDFVKNKSREEGIYEVRLDCYANRSKIRTLYEREGFECVGERILYGKYHAAFYVWKYEKSAVRHYDLLICEGNDPVHDTKVMHEYMNKWDGEPFINELQLSPDKSALEIGIGTGRLAVKVAPLCKSLTGIDFSPKTIERARQNLARFNNVTLICDDFMTYDFNQRFDIVYSSLTFMHIADKNEAISRVVGLLNKGGRFVLSIDKNRSEYIDMGNRRVKVYPDSPDNTADTIERNGILIEKHIETEFAYIFSAMAN